MSEPKKITKVERRPNESKQDCINRGVELLINEGFPPSQARAIAEEQCTLKTCKGFWKGILE